MTEPGFIWHRSGEIQRRESWRGRPIKGLSILAGGGVVVFFCRACGQETSVKQDVVEKCPWYFVSHAHGKAVKVIFQDPSKN